MIRIITGRYINTSISMLHILLFCDLHRKENIEKMEVKMVQVQKYVFLKLNIQIQENLVHVMKVFLYQL